MNNKKKLFCLLLCVVVLTITMGYLLGRHYAKPKPVAAAVDTIGAGHPYRGVLEALHIRIRAP